MLLMNKINYIWRAKINKNEIIFFYIKFNF